MTNAELIAKIKAEIERRRLHFNKEAEKYQALNNGYSQNCYGARDALRDLENCLSALKSEKPMNQEGVEDEIERYLRVECSSDDEPSVSEIARHFYDLGCRRTAEKYDELEYNRQRASGSSEIPNHLNELADYARRQVEELLVVIKKYDDYSDEQIEELRTHLMAMFLEGAGWQKKQMMKEAVEGEVFFNPYPTISLDDCKDYDFKDGDKVRIIIVKED